MRELTFAKRLHQVGVNLLVRAGGREVSLGGKNSVKGEAGDRLRLLSPGGGLPPPSSFSVLLSSLELSDTNVDGPWIRALLGTASHLSVGV